MAVAHGGDAGLGPAEDDRTVGWIEVPTFRAQLH
jgi:hypothetical protein